MTTIADPFGPPPGPTHDALPPELVELVAHLDRGLPAGYRAQSTLAVALLVGEAPVMVDEAELYALAQAIPLRHGWAVTSGLEVIADATAWPHLLAPWAGTAQRVAQRRRRDPRALLVGLDRAAPDWTGRLRAEVLTPLAGPAAVELAASIRGGA